MLHVERLRVHFGDRVALDDVDLSIGTNEIVAVLGPSGCGKTTLLRAIAGLQRVDAGRVCWDDRDLATVPAHERHFGLMFQEYALFPHRDVAGNVEFGLRMAGVARQERAARVDHGLELVGMRELRNRRIATLSGGEQQRVALARALAVEPRLLMLDEPLGALDRVWRVRLGAEISALLDRTQIPAIYVTHDHAEAFTIASRVVVMRAGRVVQSGTPADVWRRPADVWTAGFLGFGEPVPACARDDVLDSPWGALRTRGSSASGGVRLVVRPDGVRIVGRGDVDAVVERVVFEGALVSVTARVSCGPPIVFGIPARDAPATGARVSLSFDPDALLVYPPD